MTGVCSTAAGPSGGPRGPPDATSRRSTGAPARGGPSATTRSPPEQGKLPVRERVARLLDEGSFAEEALLANWDQDGLGADGVVTGIGDGRGPPGRA